MTTYLVRVIVNNTVEGKVVQADYYHHPVEGVVCFRKFAPAKSQADDRVYTVAVDALVDISIGGTDGP